MNPAVTILLIEIFAKHGPTIARKFVDFASRTDVPTKEEWIALLDEATLSYDEGKAQVRAELEARKASIP